MYVGIEKDSTFDLFIIRKREGKTNLVCVSFHLRLLGDRGRNESLLYYLLLAVFHLAFHLNNIPGLLSQPTSK